MPIKGLTDQPRAFVELGQLRKGAPKPKDGKKPGPDLTYFRAVFSEGEEEAARMFDEYYGGEPRAIEVFLPFDEPEANLESWREAYLAGGLIHRCDGENIIRAIDPDTGTVLVENGLSVETGEPVTCDGGPVAHYTDQEGKRQPVYCKPEGRLRVIVPALRRLAFMTVITHGIWDIANLSKELKGYWYENGQKLRGIRFILKRMPTMVSTPGKGGKRVRRKKWLLHIEPASSWVEDQFLMLEQAARPRIQIEEPLQLPPGIPDTNGDDEEEIVEAEVIEAETIEAEIIDSPEVTDNGDAPKDVEALYREAESRLGILKPDAEETIVDYLEKEHGKGATIKTYVKMVGQADAAKYFWKILKGSLMPQQEEIPW